MMASTWLVIIGFCMLIHSVTSSARDNESKIILNRLARSVGCYQEAMRRSFDLAEKRSLDRTARNRVYEEGLFRCRREFLLERKRRRISVIWPGTKWCGPGNIAKNFNDLGTARQTDMCCRTHDHCPNNIKSLTFEAAFRLFNPNFYTVSSCSCDNDFYQCLQRVNTTVSTNVGNMFFNTFKVQCFKAKQPGSPAMAFFDHIPYVSLTPVNNSGVS